MITFSKWMVFLFAIFISAAVANAQATRTWVSGVGDDANPCSRTAPCKTFAGAISKTAAGGEIDALDPGGFGAVTITKAITIDGGPGIAGVLVSGTNGIIVNITTGLPTEVVTLRNLDINGLGTGTNGINFMAGAGLYIENSTIYGFANGINFAPSGTSFLSVTRTLVRQAPKGALLIKPQATGSATAAIADSRFENSMFGVRAEDRSEVVVKGSIASFNLGNGYVAVSASSPAEVTVEGCVADNNQTNGVGASGTAATVFMSNTTVTHNLNGVNVAAGSTIYSFGNNRVMSNTNNVVGTPIVISQQ
jgi:hypothetical protein